MAYTIFLYAGAWVLFIFAQSMFLNGIKIAASGTTERMPDGREKDSPMILYPIAKWLDRHYMRPVYYRGEELYKLMDKLDRQFVGIWMKPDRIQDEMLFYSSDQAIDIIKGISERLKNEGILALFSDRTVMFYKEYKEHVLSKWIRLPTLGCIRCMPSYWSVLTYWTPMLLIFGFDWWQLLVWVFNVPSVTFVNTYIAQRYTE